MVMLVGLIALGALAVLTLLYQYQRSIDKGKQSPTEPLLEQQETQEQPVEEEKPPL